jgi:signal peptidase II
MQRVNRPRRKWRDIVFGCIVLLVVLADQLSKTWIRANLDRGESLFDTGFLRIIHVQNTGGIFGIFKDHSQTLLIVSIIGIIAILLLVFILRSRWPFLDSMLVFSAVGLVLGGTIGNQIDRVLLGYVTDFIDFKVWPTWNVADSAVTVGSIILAYCVIFYAFPARHQE